MKMAALELSSTEIAPRLEILKVKVNALTLPLAMRALDQAVKSRQKLRGIFCNAHTIVEAQRMPELLEAVNNSQMVAPDGMPLVWLCRLKGAKEVERVYGPDLMLAFCEYSASLPYKHYLYGSTEETLQALTHSLLSRFPGLNLVGSCSPPFRPLTRIEDEEIIAEINEVGPDVIWVGLGMPKQELWMADHQHRLNASVLLGVGAAFDFHSGKVRQAPPWMRRAGVEWLFRLIQEPRRLWRRYVFGNVRFALYILWDAIRRRGADG